MLGASSDATAPEGSPPPCTSITYRIGGITLTLQQDAPDEQAVQPFRAAYEAFQVESTGLAADVVVQARSGPIDPPPADTDAQRCETAHWVGYRSRGRQVFLLRVYPFTDLFWRMIVGDSAGARWDVTTAISQLGVSPPALHEPSPLVFPVADLIMLDAFTARGGLLFHGSGVVDRGNGLLFCGRSGRGKTTISRLWLQDGATILNDDRTLVCRRGDSYEVRGTPWHGDLPLVTASEAPLRAVFFLEHASRTALQRLDAKETLRRLLGAAWQPVWAGQSRLRAIWARSAEISRQVPAYSLEFLPERATLEQVRAVIGASA